VAGRVADNPPLRAGYAALPSTAASLRPSDDMLMRYLLSPLIRRLFDRHYTDLAAMEDLLNDGNLGWTAIQPPRLTNGPLTGTYRTAIDRNVRHGLTISRPDVAHPDAHRAPTA
jgi:NAD(P)H-binding